LDCLYSQAFHNEYTKQQFFLQMIAYFSLLRISKTFSVYESASNEFAEFNLVL